MSDTRDNYEQEIMNGCPANYKRFDGTAFRSGMRHFRDTIHAREMAKKDADIENLKHELKFIGVEPDEDDFERYPLPICFDPREERMELYRRHCKIKEDHEEWEKLTHAHELTRLNKEIERLKALLNRADVFINPSLYDGNLFSLAQNLQNEITSAITKTDNP